VGLEDHLDSLTPLEAAFFSSILPSPKRRYVHYCKGAPDTKWEIYLNRILRETEELVLEHGGIVARLAGVYGPGRSALLQKFLAGEAIVERGRDRFLNQAHRDDIATALHLLARNKARGIFNVTDHHPILLRECYQWLAAQLQRPLPVATEAPPDRKRGNSNKRVSSAKLQTLGWSPRYPTFYTAMTQSILPSFGL
jgi:nucleoside-diphosphate-sugar epimerase